jgi:hypothetical protein
MTLVIGATSKKSIWLMADRRITFRDRTKDDARKVLFLETTDGLALLGYSGLGETGKGTEPSDWMANVLRGRNLPLEHSISVLTDAVKARLPQHLDSLPGAGTHVHSILVPAFQNGEPRVYTIDLVRPSGKNAYAFRWTRHVVPRNVPGGYTTPRFIIGGSGAIRLFRDQRWMRDLLRLIKAHDAGRITAQSVAMAFAKLNNQIARIESTVGPRCIVAWKFQKGGGAHEFFDGAQREFNSSFVFVPIIARGMDLGSLVKAVAPIRLPALLRGEPMEVDEAAMNAALAKLPGGPDDRLD